MENQNTPIFLDTKILLFFMISVFFGIIYIGIIPALLLIIGTVVSMIYKTVDYLIPFVKCIKAYFFLVIAVFLLFVSCSGYQWLENNYNDGSFGLFVLMTLLLILYFIAFLLLFEKPLLNKIKLYKETAGVSRENRNARTTNKIQEIADVRGNKIVNNGADELVQWSKLLKDGIISQKEFDAVKNNIMRQFK